MCVHNYSLGMATVILVRHGRSTANTAGVLAGRSAGVRLDERGREQAEEVARRLATVRVAAVVTSPITRCRQTARTIAAALPGVPVRTDRGLTECDYGEWTGGSLKELAKTELWQVVQGQPSAAQFPGGESLAGMGARAVAAVRRLDAAIAAEHGETAVWVAVSHGDPIKAVLADALGTHLDQFQRIMVDPASVSVVGYGPGGPHVATMNSHAGDLTWVGGGAEAVVGGGAGPDVGGAA